MFLIIFLRKRKQACFIIVNLLKENNILHIQLVAIDGNQCVDILAIEGIRLDFSIDFLTYYIGFKSINQFEITKQRLLKSHVYIIDNNEE